MEHWNGISSGKDSLQSNRQESAAELNSLVDAIGNLFKYAKKILQKKFLTNHFSCDRIKMSPQCEGLKIEYMQLCAFLSANHRIFRNL